MVASAALSALPRAYGLVILTAVGNWLVLMWQAFKLAGARKEYQVKYPRMYEDKDPSVFNCVQRAHQNSLEWNPPFLLFLCVAGLSYPILSSAAGTLYNVGRIYYAKSYYSGNPHGGLWGLHGLFFLVGASVVTAVKILAA